MTDDERQDAPQDDAPAGDASDGAAGEESAGAAGEQAAGSAGEESADAAEAEQPAAPGPVGGQSHAEAAAEAPGAEEIEQGTSEQPAAAQAEAEGAGRADESAGPTEPPTTEGGPPPVETAEPPAEEAGEAGPSAERVRAERPKKRKKDDEPGDEDVIPGAHLEPDLVLEEARPTDEDAEFARYAAADDDEAAGEPAAEDDVAEPAPVAATPLELAAGARYMATGKRKTSVARVVLRPGRGRYFVNGRRLEQYFPRPKLQHAARQPLEVTGHAERMDVVARLHGGGVAAQAGALRHGIARALVEADPNLRGELKRRGFLTRDARVKERKKAGLKKARKRPQFSKR